MTDTASGRWLDLLHTCTGPYVLGRIGATRCEIEALNRLQAGTRVLSIHGANCTDKKAFMSEIARVFEFPDYFGHNWDALEECLCDLEWLPAEAYVLICTDAQHVLAARYERDTLVEVLNAAGRHWAEAGIPFHAVLLFPDSGSAGLWRIPVT